MNFPEQMISCNGRQLHAIAIKVEHIVLSFTCHDSVLVR